MSTPAEIALRIFAVPYVASVWETRPGWVRGPGVYIENYDENRGSNHFAVLRNDPRHLLVLRGDCDLNNNNIVWRIRHCQESTQRGCQWMVFIFHEVTGKFLWARFFQNKWSSVPFGQSIVNSGSPSAIRVCTAAQLEAAARTWKEQRILKMRLLARVLPVVTLFSLVWSYI